MGEGIIAAVEDLFGIVTSGLATFGEGLGKGLNAAAKFSFFEVSAEGVITGLGAYGAVIGFGMAISLAMSACYLIFNII